MQIFQLHPRPTEWRLGWAQTSVFWQTLRWFYWVLRTEDYYFMPFVHVSIIISIFSNLCCQNSYFQIYICELFHSTSGSWCPVIFAMSWALKLPKGRSLVLEPTSLAASHNAFPNSSLIYRTLQVPSRLISWWNFTFLWLLRSVNIFSLGFLRPLYLMESQDIQKYIFY